MTSSQRDQVRVVAQQLSRVASELRTDSDTCETCGSRTYADREAYRVHEQLDAICRRLMKLLREERHA